MSPLDQVLVVLEGPQPVVKTRKSARDRAEHGPQYIPVHLSTIDPELAGDLAVSILEAHAPSHRGTIADAEVWEWCMTRLILWACPDDGNAYVAAHKMPNCAPSRATVAARLDLLAPSRFAGMKEEEWDGTIQTSGCCEGGDECICKTGRTTATVLDALAAAMRGGPVPAVVVPRDVGWDELAPKYTAWGKRLNVSMVVYGVGAGPSGTCDPTSGVEGFYWTHEAVEVWEKHKQIHSPMAGRLTGVTS